MKKIMLMLAVICLLTACQAENTPTPQEPANTEAAITQQTSEETIARYFPVKANTYYEYVSSPTSVADQQIYNTYLGNNRVQRRVGSSIAEATEVLELQNGELRLIYAEPQFYYMENILAVQPTLDALILKEPLAVGQAWQMDETASCEITGMDVPVDTQYGSFTAMEVTTIFQSGINQKDYYAKDMGLVKTIYNANGEMTIELAAVSENVSLDIPFLFYYPSMSADPGEDGVKKEWRVLKFGTNAELHRLFHKEFQIPAEGQGGAIISENININALAIDRANNALHLDMSEAFVAEMNAGAGYESMLLHSIANTLGNFYDAERLYLTINGKDYESGHISMTAEDFITVEKETAEDDIAYENEGDIGEITEDDEEALQ